MCLRRVHFIHRLYQLLTKPTHVSIIESTCVSETEGLSMAAKGEKTREFILDSSYALFAQKGFKSVTMKDICEATGMSRGGLYSHFASTKEIFEAMITRMTGNDADNLYSDMEKGISAVTILKKTLKRMGSEMAHPEDSLSLAVYEYSETVDPESMLKINREGEKKWASFIRYGIDRGEFNEVNVDEIVNILMYSYQGVRMWSRIIPLKTRTIRSITDHIEHQLTGDRK